MAKRWLVWCAGGLAVVSASAGYLGAGGPRQQPAGSLPPLLSPQRAIVNQYCIACHNDRVQTAGLTLTAVDPQRAGEGAETL